MSDPKIDAAMSGCEKLSYAYEREACQSVVRACEAAANTPGTQTYVLMPADGSSRHVFGSLDSCLTVSKGAAMIFGGGVRVAPSKEPLPKLVPAKPAPAPAQPAPASARTDELSEHHCRGADADCSAAVAQCGAALAVMCKEAHPFSDAERAECERGIAGAMQAGRVDDAAVKEWLGKNFFAFPIIYDDGGKMRVKKFDSLKKCMASAPAVANGHRVPTNFAALGHDRYVVDYAASRRRTSRNDYCVAEYGWMSPSEIALSHTPKGEMLWYHGRMVGVMGVDMWTAERTPINTSDWTYSVTHMQARHKLDPTGDNFDAMASKIEDEVLDFGLGEFGTYSATCCMECSPSPRVTVEFLFSGDAGSAERTINRFLEVLNVRLGRNSDYGALRGKVDVQVFSLVPTDEHTGIYVSATTPSLRGAKATEDRTYGPFDDGRLKIRPLR